MPQDFLTTPERLRYQTVPASLLEADIRQHFHLLEADRAFLVPFRGAANSLVRTSPESGLSCFACPC